MGAVPHRAAKEADERSRSGFSPAVRRSCAPMAGPTPLMAIRAGLARRAEKVQARDPQQLVALAQVAGRTGGDDVFPAGDPSPRPGQDMVEGQFTLRSAILAAEFVPQKKIEARECHALLGLDVIFQDDDGGDLYRFPLASDHFVVLRKDRDPIQKHRLDRLLPGPEREGIIGQGPEIRVQHQRRKMPKRRRFAHEMRPEVVRMRFVEHSNRLRPVDLFQGPQGESMSPRSGPQSGRHYISRPVHDKTRLVAGASQPRMWIYWRQSMTRE